MLFAKGSEKNKHILSKYMQILPLSRVIARFEVSQILTTPGQKKEKINTRTITK